MDIGFTFAGMAFLGLMMAWVVSSLLARIKELEGALIEMAELVKARGPKDLAILRSTKQRPGRVFSRRNQMSEQEYAKFQNRPPEAKNDPGEDRSQRKR